MSNLACLLSVFMAPAHPLITLQELHIPEQYTAFRQGSCKMHLMVCMPCAAQPS